MTSIVFPSSSIQGLVFCAFLTICVPIAFLWYYKKKTGAKISSFFVGIAFSLLFSFIGTTILNTLVLSVLGAGTFLNSQTHPIYASIYASFAAGLMASLGSYVGLKYAMKKRTGIENTIVFGVGKGGLECIMNGGTIYIMNLIAAILINSIGSEEYFKKLGLQGAELEMNRQLFAKQAAVPVFSYLTDATYLLISLCLHVALTVLVDRAVHDAKSRYFLPIAMGLHALGYIPMYISKQAGFENSLVVLTIAVVYTFVISVYVYRFCKEKR